MAQHDLSYHLMYQAMVSSGILPMFAFNNGESELVILQHEERKQQQRTNCPFNGTEERKWRIKQE